jgi:hypothetical protein
MDSGLADSSRSLIACSSFSRRELSAPVAHLFQGFGLVGAGEVWIESLKPSLVDVPPGVITAIEPDLAPLGTVTVTLVSSLVAGVASTPPNVTLVVCPKLVPVIVTVWPTFADSGANELISGEGAVPVILMDFLLSPG